MTKKKYQAASQGWSADSPYMALRKTQPTNFYNLRTKHTPLLATSKLTKEE